MKQNTVNDSTEFSNHFEFETSIEVSGGILTNLQSAQVFPPKLDGDLSPGFSYFTFGKFGLGALH